MTKVYDALREAEAVRLQRIEPEFAPAAARVAPEVRGASAAQAAESVRSQPDAASDLEQLREIICGALFNDYERAMDRLEQRIGVEAAALRSELAAIDRRVSDRIREIEARNTHAHSDLRDQLLSQSNLLNDAIQERSAHITRSMNEGLQELRETKIDRTTFSSFLGNLAAHIGEQGVSSAEPSEQAALE